MRKVFPPEWRTQSRRKRRFYARYMRWLERTGYVLVAGVLAAFVLAFRYPVDDLVTADKVAITPLATPLETASDPVWVVRWLAEDFAEVRKGQPLVEFVVDGDHEAYARWQAVDELRQKVGDTPEVLTLLAQFPKPRIRTWNAPVGGTLRQNPSPTGLFDADAPAGQVVDYNDLRLEASFAGDTVPQAKVGQMAKVTGITVDSGTGTLLRANLSGTPAVSGKILGEGVKKALNEKLAGTPVRLRDDVPLRVSEVSDVQVDADVVGGPYASGPGVTLDPSSDLAIQAQVVEGAGTASVQTSDLPPDAAQAAREAVRKALQGQSVRRADGTTVALGDVSDARFIVKLKAETGVGGSQTPIDATKLTRTFDAKLKLLSPPVFLIEAVKTADRAGKAVTAHIDLRTGTRPIAFILLKKS
ncbi:hypothetical protein BH11ARM2_BH11ARM2_27560 [soil metagenome]